MLPMAESLSKLADSFSSLLRDRFHEVLVTVFAQRVDGILFAGFTKGDVREDNIRSSVRRISTDTAGIHREMDVCRGPERGVAQQTDAVVMIASRVDNMHLFVFPQVGALTRGKLEEKRGKQYKIEAWCDI